MESDPDARRARRERGEILDDLVARCIEALEGNDPAAVERICAEHPDLAALVRKRLEGLGQMGLLYPEEAAEEPEQIGPYRILELLGRGGMGEVFLAEQREPVRRQVAVKLIKLGMDTRQVLVRFEAERQALAIMNHPNIARVFDAGTTEQGRPYFVMEYAPGPSITAYCDHHHLTPRERLELFLPVCEAVQHAHHKGVIHRDLKPSNVLVTDQDGKALTKIIDFGVSKAINQRLSEQTIYTAQGMIIGTPEYMSPEQAGTDSPDVDTRTDVYSLGVMLYELLTGSLPFSSQRLRESGYEEMRRIIREEEPATPSLRVSSREADTSEVASLRRTDPVSLCRTLRADLDWITLRALEKERDRRYGTALELAADIRRYLDHEPVLASPPGRIYRFKKLVRRHREAAIVVLLVFVALLAGLVATTAMYLRSEKNAQLARNHLRDMLDLSTIRILEDLKSQADRLWPAHPTMIAPMKIWLERAGRMREHLAKLQPKLAELRAEARLVSAEPRVYEFADDAQMSANDKLWRHELLTRLVEDLEAFLAGPAVMEGMGGYHGTSLPEVARRMKFAEGIVVRSVEGEEAAAQWARVIADVRRVGSKYGGLELVPQVGLLPIGQDPVTGLREFAHLQTGTPPARDARGKLIFTADSSLVFVLIPGAASSVHGVALEAFFLAKYEMTQGQWLRVVGQNPSRSPAGTQYGETKVTLRHPVEGVSWEVAAQLLHRLNLDFPTEVQWEYACRAGSQTPWWTGERKESLVGAANLRDQTRLRYSQQAEGYTYEAWNDGFAAHAPVGSLRANAFGLHDVHGNVWEWCRDWQLENAGSAPRPGDGLRGALAGGLHAMHKVTRGGSYFDLAVIARSARSSSYAWRGSHGTIGVRPVHRISWP